MKQFKLSDMSLFQGICDLQQDSAPQSPGKLRSHKPKNPPQNSPKFRCTLPHYSTGHTIKSSERDRWKWSLNYTVQNKVFGW